MKIEQNGLEHRVAPEKRRGRGAVSNASGRFELEQKSAFRDGWSDEEPLPPFKTVVATDQSRTILARNNSPDVPFDRSINMYRGCEHGCIYCFARPTHAYLGYSAGLDFESQLFIKPEAATLLREALAKRGYRPATIAIGTNTDPYQPIERRLKLMREVLEVLWKHRHPVSIVTKGALICRDLDILEDMAKLGLAKAALSITTLDRQIARAMEPRASTPTKRLEAVKKLAEVGVPTGVMMAPVVPGLTDHEIEAVVKAASEAGAQWAEHILLRLPFEVSALFQEWLSEAAPNKAARVMKLVRETRGGKDYDAEWGKRMRGEGPIAALIAQRFKAAKKRFGLSGEALTALRTDLFRKPSQCDDQYAFDL